MAEALFLIVHETREGKRVIFLTLAHYHMAARIKAAIAKHPGKYVEGGEIDAAIARRVPKAMIGRTLTAGEAEQLLALLDGVPAKRKKTRSGRSRERG
jgi:predicted nucleotidyltransferase